MNATRPRQSQSDGQPVRTAAPQPGTEGYQRLFLANTIIVRQIAEGLSSNLATCYENRARCWLRQRTVTWKNNQLGIAMALPETRTIRHVFWAVGFIILSTFVPTLLRWGWGVFENLTEGQANSLVSVFLCSCIVMWMVINTRSSILNSVYSVAFIYSIFIFSLSYFVFLFMRLEFVIYIILSSLILTLVFSYFLAKMRRSSRFVYYLVPYGDCLKASDDAKINWRVLSNPSISNEKQAIVVADLKNDMPDEWQRFLTRCVIQNIPVIDYSSSIEVTLNRINIDNLYEHFVNSLNPSPIYMEIKGIVDRFMALILLIFIIPAAVFIAILIKYDSNGPVLFKQVRIGYRGKPFLMYKFRTMYHDMESKWKGSTGKDDPRITNVGKVLRRHRLDELPQLLNVLIGEMSLIGPRPEAVSLARIYSRKIPFFNFRYVVKPGITGWAQVEQGFAAEIDTMQKKLSYDFFYIKYFSPTLDVLIVLKTIGVIIFGKGYR